MVDTSGRVAPTEINDNNKDEDSRNRKNKNVV